MQLQPDQPLDAVARGGPMDGSLLGPTDAESYQVRMSDGTRWTYVATAEREQLADSAEAVVFVCTGRS